MASKPTHGNQTARELERKARRLLELRAGRTFDHAEWKRIRAKLMEFHSVLRGWEEQAATERQMKLQNG